MTASLSVAGAQPFVEFDDVWLAYSDELRACHQVAVEAILLQAQPASSSPSSVRRAAPGRPS